jgi:putative ABC transport system substrate-binding protein
VHRPRIRRWQSRAFSTQHGSYPSRPNRGRASLGLVTQEVEATARNLGLAPITIEIRRVEEIAPALDGLKGRADALYLNDDPLIVTQHVLIHTLALNARLPTSYQYREMVETGGLMAYGPNRTEQFQRAADLVDKILHGTKPAEIPVEQPTKFDFVINLTTPKALGITVPPTLLAIADEVIE